MKLQELLEQASNQEDPLERAKFLNREVLPAIAELKQSVIMQRALSVKEACDFGNEGEGLTYSQVANELGVSKPLIQQIVALARQIHTIRTQNSTNSTR